jgi:hypothetical protein
MSRKPRDPPLQTASSKPLTSAERNARWRLAHDRRGAGSSTPAGKGTVCISPPELLVTCIPHGNVDLDELEKSARATMALYDKLIGIVGNWLDRLDADGFMAFRLLGPALESLAILRTKIGEQRGKEALELLRSRFNDNIKPKAN